jgi:hypothetical protein
MEIQVTFASCELGSQHVLELVFLATQGFAIPSSASCASFSLCIPRNAIKYYLCRLDKICCCRSKWQKQAETKPYFLVLLAHFILILLITPPLPIKADSISSAKLLYYFL